MKPHPNLIEQYREQGYAVVKQAIDGQTAEAICEHYMAMRAEGPKPGDKGGNPTDVSDPLNAFPRLIQMQRWDAQTDIWSQANDILDPVEAFLGDEAVLNQTMLYFKPPGSRGQALHQDQQYITIEPLIAAWVALDRCDAENGQMVVVPGSHKLGVLPVEHADEAESFTEGQTHVPEDLDVVGVDMEPGDALFFDGKLIHGSYTNHSKDRFRRSFICHFVGAHACSFEPTPGTHMGHLQI